MLSSIIYPLAPREGILRFYGDGSVYKNTVWEMSSLNILLPTPAVQWLAWGKFVKLFMIGWQHKENGLLYRLQTPCWRLGAD